MRNRNVTTFCLLSLMSFCLLSCGGRITESNGMASSPPNATSKETPPDSQPVFKQGDVEVVASIGSAGGTLKLDNGAELRIPEGVNSEERNIVFRQAPPTTALNIEDTQTIGPVLVVAPKMTSFAGEPISVSIPMSGLPTKRSDEKYYLAMEEAADNQRALIETSVLTRWRYWPVTVRDGRLEGSRNTFEGMRVQFVISSR